MSKWLLVDGFNLAYRCFHALPELTRADGFPTGALHGWVKSLWKLMDLEKPDATLVFFDLGESEERVAPLFALPVTDQPVRHSSRPGCESIRFIRCLHRLRTPLWVDRPSTLRWNCLGLSPSRSTRGVSLPC